MVPGSGRAPTATADCRAAPYVGKRSSAGQRAGVSVVAIAINRLGDRAVAKAIVSSTTSG
jgi:hypothetical protein